MNSYQNPQALNPNMNENASAPWGKLVSVNSNLPNFDLRNPSYKIGRLDTCDIHIDDIRVSGVHCIIKRASDGQVYLEDTSSNGTYLENQKVGKNYTKRIYPGKKFFILHKTKVQKQEDVLGFIFSLNEETNPLKRERADGKKEENDINIPNKHIKPPMQNFEGFTENIRCSLCEDCIYKCVSTIPCFHNFCSACYSTWMLKSTQCPTCKQEVHEIKKNVFLDNIVQNFLEKNPQFRKPLHEYQEMDRKNNITCNRLVLANNSTSQGRKGMTSSQEEEVVKRNMKSPSTSAVNHSENKTNQWDFERKWAKYYEIFHRFTSE